MALINVQEVAYGAESSFNENASSLSSNTWDKRIPVISVTPTTEQSRETDGSIQNRANASRPGYRGLRTATFSFVTPVAGHMAATNGALTQTWQQDLLSDGLGGGNVSQVGGTVGAGASTTSLPYSGGVTVVSGAVVRVGTVGDGRGEGKCAVVNAVGSPATLLTALPGTPNNGDALHVAQMAYPDETVDGNTNSKRFMWGWNSTTDSGAQFHVTGCQMSRLSVEYPFDGRMPTYTFTYTGAYWGNQATTVPSSLSLENCDAAPVSAGQLFFQTTGTTTRAILSPSSLSLDLAITLPPKIGPAAGQPTFGNINGYHRGTCIPRVTMVVPWTTTHITNFDSDGSDTTYKQILFQSNSTEKRCAGFYMPRAFPVGRRPLFTDSNGIVYMEVVYQGTEGGTSSDTALVRSAIRFFSM